MSEALIDFIKDCYKAGKTHKEIGAILKETGWAQEQIDEALGQFVDRAFPVASPSFNRKLSADRNRINDLRRLSNDIDQYFDEQKKLPDQLADLSKLRSWGDYERRLDDPTTKELYEYKRSDTFAYELCANFELTSKDAELEWRNYYGSHNMTWEYDIGHHCFKFGIPEGKRISKAK